MFTDKDNSLVFQLDSEMLCIEPWGLNAVRVRSTHENSFPPENWALSEPVPHCSAMIQLHGARGATFRNGRITAQVSPHGKVTIRDNQRDKVLLEEYTRHRLDVTDPTCSALNLQARQFTPRLGTDSYRLTARFESLDEDEHIYGMGQYQHPFLNLKGADLELAQRNSQASIPFALSSLGYGLLWNQPAIGRATFGKNVTTFEAFSTRVLDYWIVAGDSPSEIVRAYAKVTGTVPLMPEYGLGFWQCKLRYQTQEEIVAIAQEHKVKRNLPMDVLVVDFFHWPKEGDWRFDPTFWPDPDAMITELRSYGIELMVSVWPTVDRLSENFDEMLSRNMLVRQDRGFRVSMGPGSCIHFDATNPAARSFVWAKVKKNYHDKGVRVFWLDEAEPEYSVYDFDTYRYYKGPSLMIGNIFPLDLARGFYEGMKNAGQDRVVNLVRCAWAGSQKYGALLWSGDIASSWSSFRNQLSAGLNVGIAGIPWWTTDIGGFHGGNPNDPEFRELFVRWFQWATFCPVMRLHGDREPRQPQLGNSGGSRVCSGAANEVWSYGEEIYAICKTYLALRETLRPYIRTVMDAAHARGDPIIRPLFYEFPNEPPSWSITDQYLFGSRYLVSPILMPGQRRRDLWLPNGASWKQISAEGAQVGDAIKGGCWVTVDVPLNYMPVFERL